MAWSLLPQNNINTTLVNPRASVNQDFWNNPSRPPANLNSAYNQNEQQNQAIAEGSAQNTQEALGWYNKAWDVIQGLNIDFNPYINSARTNVRNNAQSSMNRALSLAGAELGKRGLSGSPSAALRRQAIQDSLGQRASAEADIFQSVIGPQTQLALGQMGTLPSIAGGAAGVLQDQLFPATDYLGWYTAQQGEQQYNDAQQNWQQMQDLYTDPLYIIANLAMPMFGKLFPQAFTG